MLHDQPSHCVATSAHLHQIHAAGQPGDIEYHFPGALLANRDLYSLSGKIMDTDFIPGYSFSFHGKSSRNRIGIYVECTIGKIVNAGNHGTHRDGEGQRGEVVRRIVVVRVCRRVGVVRCRGGGGWCAGEVAGARVKRQPGGRGRGQGVGDGAVASGGFRQGQRRNFRALRVGLIVYGRAAEGRGAIRCLRCGDGEGQRGGIVGRHVVVRVCRRVGVHRRRGGGGGCAGEVAGARVKRQPGGNGRGQGVGEGAIATGGFRQGQRLNHLVDDVALVGDARIRGEGRGGARCHRRIHRDRVRGRGGQRRGGIVAHGDRDGNRFGGGDGRRRIGDTRTRHGSDCAALGGDGPGVGQHIAGVGVGRGRQ